MIYDATEKDSDIKKSVSVFADINVRTLKHAFMYPKGLLSLLDLCRSSLSLRHAQFLKTDASGKRESP